MRTDGRRGRRILLPLLAALLLVGTGLAAATGLASTAAAAPPATITFGPPTVTGSTASVGYTVNRTARQVAARQCSLRLGQAQTSTDCGAQVTAATRSTGYQASFTALAPGSYRYTVIVRLRNGDSTRRSTTFTVAAPPANRPPVVTDQTFVLKTGSTQIGGAGLLASASDPDGDPITLVLPLLTQPQHGQFTLDPVTTAFTYISTPGFVGTDTLTYQVTDGKALSNIGTVTFDVVLDRAPVAVDDSYTTPMGRSLTALPTLNDFDIDGDRVTMRPLLSGPAHGSISVSTGTNGVSSVTYVPDPGFSGLDSFTYQVTDGMLLSNVATVTITVLPNQPPVAENDSYTAIAGRTLVVPAPSFLANDHDPNNDPLTPRPFLTTPAHGAVAVINTGVAGYEFRYTPDAGFTGTDTMTYQVSDGKLLSNIATITITVVPDQPPVAVDDAYTAVSGQTLVVPAPGFLANDHDPNNDPLTPRPFLTTPAHGAVAVINTGVAGYEFRYTPDAGFTGTDTMTYQVSDGTLLSNIATITITVIPPPPA